MGSWRPICSIWRIWCGPEPRRRYNSFISEHSKERIGAMVCTYLAVTLCEMIVDRSSKLVLGTPQSSNNQACVARSVA